MEKTADDVLLKKQTEPTLEELLYPYLPYDYFKDKDKVFEDDDMLYKELCDAQSAKTMPYIKIKNLNDGDAVAPAKNAVEAGIMFSF